MLGGFGGWLKTSVPGIILLGALGSILALVLLRLTRLGLLKMLGLLERFLRVNYRPYALTRLLIRRYLDEGAWVKLLVCALICVGEWVVISTGLMMLVGITVFRFLASGVTLSVVS